MIDLVLKKTTGKASFVGELSFGSRGQEQSLLTAGDGNSFHIQNLYINYAFSDKFTMAAGFMGTFIGYEVISPAANFNYNFLANKAILPISSSKEKVISKTWKWLGKAMRVFK